MRWKKWTKIKSTCRADTCTECQKSMFPQAFCNL